LEAPFFLPQSTSALLVSYWTTFNPSTSLSFAYFFGLGHSHELADTLPVRYNELRYRKKSIPGYETHATDAALLYTL